MSEFKDREISERRHFDALALNYDSNYGYNNDFFNYKKAKKLRPLTDLFSKTRKANLRILELGCGTGEYTADLAKIFPQAKIIGLDISPKILKLAQKKCRRYPNLKFIVGSAYDLPFPDSGFDLVTGFYIVHHLNLPKLLAEVDRVLKPGGMAYFVEPNLLNPVVFLVKNVPFLKQRVGDSPEESAVNPLTVVRDLPAGLALRSVLYTEFSVPLKFLPSSAMIFVDKITSALSLVPGLRLISGSVIIQLQKFE